MKSFKDTKGTAWIIEINVGTLKRVQALTGVNLADIITLKNGVLKADLLERLSGDPVFLVDILYAVCKDQCDKNSLSDLDFGSRMAGDCITDAVDALIGDLIDFFPEAKRVTLRKIMETERRVQEKMKQDLNTIINSPELEKQIEAELLKLNPSSGNAPESSE